MPSTSLADQRVNIGHFQTGIILGVQNDGLDAQLLLQAHSKPSTVRRYQVSRDRGRCSRR